MSTGSAEETKPVAAVRERRPDWLRVRAPWGEDYNRVRALMRGMTLHTVCEEAHCPNIGECWGSGTATIMILGEVCTRACRFCAVTTGNPRGIVDHLEPARVAEAIARLQLKYVVITSVDRDDLPDGGAGIFAETVRQVHQAVPGIIVEVLTPDFRGDPDKARMVVDAHPEVFGQNVETVRRLTPAVRDKRAGYDQTLRVLRAVKEMAPTIFTKSSIMVGLGEQPDEVIETMRDLRTHGVDLVALGQYLRPTDQRRHYPIAEYVHPDQFKAYKRAADEMGFLFCAAGPLVRSSYKAWEAAMLFRDRAAPAVGK
jgi:lipoic acid synthetase